MSIGVKVSGAWKDVASVHVRVGGAWKSISQAYARVSDAWEELLGASGPTTLTFVASAISEAETVTIPATAQAGDLAVLIDFASGAGVPPSVVPPGWISIVRAEDQFPIGADPAIEASYKILGGGEPNTVIAGMTSSHEAKLIFVFRPNAPISEVTPGSANAEVRSSDPAAQTVTASGQPVPLVVIGGAGVNTGGAVFSAATTPAFDAQVVTTGNGRLRSGYKIYNSSPVDHTVDMPSIDFNGLCCFYLRVE